MTKTKKMCFLYAIIIMCVVTLAIYIYQTSSHNPSGKIQTSNTSVSKKFLVVKVDKENIGVMELNSTDLYNVNISEERNVEFKKGQEILIYYNGLFTGGPVPTISNVGKIEIIKEQSDMAIPDEAIKSFYNSYENVYVVINEITQSKLVFTISDKNNLPYDYSNSYRILKKEVVLPENMVLESTNTSMKEVTRIQNIEDSSIIGIIEKTENGTKCSYDWEKIYGRLDKRLL